MFCIETDRYICEEFFIPFLNACKLYFIEVSLPSSTSKVLLPYFGKQNGVTSQIPLYFKRIQLYYF